MSGLLTATLAGSVLALVGWAAWALSGGLMVARPAPETQFDRGLSALLRGDRGTALMAFAATVQADSENVEAYVHLGNLLRDQGEGERAYHLHRDLMVRAGLTSIQERSVREALVLDLIALHRPAQAVQEGRDLRELDRRDAGALRVLIQAHEAAGDWESAFEARADLARLVGERGRNGLARYRTAIGESLIRDGKVEEAKKHLKEALRLERDHPAALLRLGDIYYAGGRAERAIVLWKGLAWAHPDMAYLVLDRLEGAYFERGRFSEMAQMYEELLARSPRDARILVALARMHLKRGDLTEAGSALAEALEIAPDSLAARLLLVNVYRRRGELSRALDEMETLLRGLQETRRFSCSACEAHSDDYWTRCPSCFAWATIA